MSEKPLERLNYFNGQQLGADKLKTEQEYHIRTRRWLNKSLHTAGIADGLEVHAVKDKPIVSITPGLALDNEGREIILLEETPVEVISFAGTDATRVEGNYLVIEYAEQPHGHTQSQCTPGNLAPSFIEASPKFSWLPYIPHPGSNQIVLAQVELSKDCSKVDKIGRGQRRRVDATTTATIQQYALEGEREVAFIPKDSFPPPNSGETDNRTFVEVVGRIYFHIRGGQPPLVTLYLRAEPFSRLHYTEIGRHTHNTTGTTTIPNHVVTEADLHHFHGLSKVITDYESPIHTHTLVANLIPGASAADLLNNNNEFGLQLFKDTTHGIFRRQEMNNDVAMETINGEHKHRLIKDGAVGTHDAAYTDSAYTGFRSDQSPIPFTLTLSHAASTANPTIDPVGVLFSSRTSGSPLTFVDDLQVRIGYVGNLLNRTDEIREQLANFYPNDWRVSSNVFEKLGNGGGGHVFATKGTGAILLNNLDINFSEGEYCIEFGFDNTRTTTTGGKIHYNLYIE